MGFTKHLISHVKISFSHSLNLHLVGVKTEGTMSRITCVGRLIIEALSGLASSHRARRTFPRQLHKKDFVLIIL